jgi:hypothetical protein
MRSARVRLPLHPRLYLTGSWGRPDTSGAPTDRPTTVPPSAGGRWPERSDDLHPESLHPRHRHMPRGLARNSPRHTTNVHQWEPGKPQPSSLGHPSIHYSSSLHPRLEITYVAISPIENRLRLIVRDFVNHASLDGSYSGRRTDLSCRSANDANHPSFACHRGKLPEISSVGRISRTSLPRDATSLLDRPR